MNNSIKIIHDAANAARQEAENLGRQAEEAEKNAKTLRAQAGEQLRLADEHYAAAIALQNYTPPMKEEAPPPPPRSPPPPKGGNKNRR